MKYQRSNQKDLDDAGIFEIHYWLPGNSHSMDANVQNSCEYEILALIREVAKVMRVELDVETEPFGEGGLRHWLKITLREEGRKAGITTAIIVALLTALLVTPISKITEELVHKLFEDIERVELEKEGLRLDNQKKRLDIQDRLHRRSKINSSDYHDAAINKRRSNFYFILEKYQRIEKVGFSSLDTNKVSITKEIAVERSEFGEFVVSSDDLPPLELDNAAIEIIAPVLKKGNYKWWGIFRGETISFNMQSQEFKDLVQGGKVEFKNGSAIDCQLRIRRKLDGEAGQRVVGYDVVRVNHYFQKNKAIETVEGKKHRQRIKMSYDQTRLFDLGDGANGQ